MAKKSKTTVSKKKNVPEMQASPKEGIILHAGASRNELMLAAKERGIKNFRVLNKKELESVLADGVSQNQINKIVSGAVTRWKSGWGKRKKK
jgi:hypothetical protein